jgi:ABC-type Fe3+-hydroxamate transport system substrate-binding protein
MKRLLFIFTLLFSVTLLFTSCTERADSADQLIQEETEANMQEANRQVGQPDIVNFQEKKIAKMIYEVRDQEDLICHAYLVNTMTGQVGQYLGECIGYGLPYSTQFSNPDKVVSGANMLGYNSMSYESILVMSQPEPNGLFMPGGLSATWLLMIDPETDKPRVVYIEPEIIVSPFKFHKSK